MLILFNIKCEIHTGFYTLYHFYWNIHVVVKRQPYQIILRMLATVTLVFNYQVYVGLLFWIMELFLQHLICLENSCDWFKIKVIGDNMRGQIFFISIVDILSWPQLCFESILLIILDTVSCSNKLNWKCFYSYVFVLGNVFREVWANILKERVEVVCNAIFIVDFVSINYEIWRIFLLHLLSNSLMVVKVCFIFDTYLLNFDS